MSSRLTTTVLILSLASLLVAACGSDDSPTDPGNTTGGGGDGDGENPAVTSVSPPGAGVGITAKIIGTDFGSGKGAGAVTVGGVNAAIESWEPTEIEFIVPAGVTSDATSSVAVTTSAGKTASSQIDITPPNTYRVTTDIASDHYPCWGPGADWIYFSSTRSGGANWDLYRIPATGGEAERLTGYDGPDFYPDVKFSTGEIAWSSTENHLGNNPDGDFEIFSGYLVAVTGGAVTMGMDTRNESRDLDPSWANTVHAGYSMTSTWEEVDLDGYFAGWKVVLHGTGLPTELTEGRQPNFSGDGRWVVYNLDGNIHKIETTGGAPVKLTDSGTDWYPDWGWANDKIVFQRYGGAEDIMIMNADGTDIQELVATSNGEYYPRWSPDCSRIVYYAHRWGNFDIYVYVVP